MRVLVTGAAGNLGRATMPVLAEAGHTPVGFDLRTIDGPYASVHGDVRDPSSVLAAAEGCDAIVHAAALHGVHLAQWPSRDFWAINLLGTCHVYDAAREHGIRRVVLASTMGVYGQSLEPRENAWAYVTEEAPPLPKDVYGESKLLAEKLARYSARVDGITTVALRFGMYVPAGFEHYGFRLLFGGVDERDVAQAVLLSLGHDLAQRFDVFDVMADTPFAPQDVGPLNDDPMVVVERYWPGSAELFAEKGIDPAEHLWGRAVWPIHKAKRELGFRPAWDFGTFLDAVREDATERFPFLGATQWGVAAG